MVENVQKYADTRMSIQRDVKFFFKIYRKQDKIYTRALFECHVGDGIVQNDFKGLSSPTTYQVFHI